LNIYKGENFELAYTELNSGQEPVFLWAHGWGQNHQAFLPLAESVKPLGSHWLIDFPGFGESPTPAANADNVWGTGEYADAAAEFLRAKGLKNVIWVGHSFGCRIGLQMAIRHPDLIAGLFLISAAGIPPKRSFLKELKIKAKIVIFKTFKKLIRFGLSEDWVMKTFTTGDYKNAGDLRKILVKVVNQDLSPLLGNINTPVHLVFGSHDEQTPPEIGYRLERMIENAKMIQLEGFDHYSILTTGSHQVAALFKTFVNETLSKKQG